MAISANLTYNKALQKLRLLHLIEMLPH